MGYRPSGWQTFIFHLSSFIFHLSTFNLTLNTKHEIKTWNLYNSSNGA